MMAIVNSNWNGGVINGGAGSVNDILVAVNGAIIKR